jgi:hypothetical protein
MMSRANSIVVILLGVLVAGCGQGEYDARMDTAASAIAARGKAAQGETLMPAFFKVVDANQAPQGLQLKLPMLFGQQTTNLGDIPRAKFSPTDIPGFCFTMERPLADDAGKQIPAYCYVYSVNKATTPADALHTTIQSAVSAFDPAAAWNNSAPAGSIPVKLLQAKGNMEYELAGAVIESLPSKLQLYSLDAGANQIVIGFRAADSVSTKHKFFEAAAQSISTAQLDTGAAAPAPAPAPMPNP